MTEYDTDRIPALAHEHRELNLPSWAQAKIARLRSTVGRLDRALSAADEISDMQADPASCAEVSWSSPQRGALSRALPAGAEVTFFLRSPGSEHPDSVRVSLREDSTLRVSTPRTPVLRADGGGITLTLDKPDDNEDVEVPS